MVCRENKARSSYMGFTKRLLRQAGYGDCTDSEVQSLLHENRHRFVGSRDPELHEYVASIKGMRQQILNDPTISDGDKFRPSTGRGGQPGLITRLDEELERVRTGKDEKGKALTDAQKNTGRDFAAMARLTSSLARAQQSKHAYTEVYARHMGVSVDEAAARYRTLIDRRATDRQNTKISLSDNWQEKLSVAGITAGMQADMGQSNQHREALRLMEAERQARVRGLPSRPAIRPEHITECLEPDDPRVATQCVGGCGQFGHTADSCPHQARVEQSRGTAQAYDQVRTKLDDQMRFARAKDLLSKVDDPDTEWPYMDQQGQRLWIDPNTYHWHPVDDPRVRAGMEDWAGRYDAKSTKQLTAQTKKAKEAVAEADRQLNEARGPVPQVSSFLDRIGYNPETGVVQVTTKGYKLKRSGEQRPPKTYTYRMAPADYEKLLAEGSLGSGVSNSLFARASQGGNQSYQWENPDEAREAALQRQCPSCGRWASMTSLHTCPVSGSADSKEEHLRREQLRENRERAQLASLPVMMMDSKPRHRVLNYSRGSLSQEGMLVYPNARETAGAIDKGEVAVGNFRGEYLGAQVNGRVFVWAEPRTGDRLYRVDSMKCSCGRKDCRHTDRAASTLHRPFNATRVYGTPGAPDLSATAAPVAQDTFQGFDHRLDYAQIRAGRRERAEELKRDFVGRPANYGYATGPLQPRTGNPASGVPTVWEDDNGRVDLNDTGSVVSAVRERLDQRTARDPQASNWKVTPDRAGGVWIRSLEATQAAGRGGEMFASHQSELQRAFSLPSQTGWRGVYIPADRAWRHEMLSRLMKRDPIVEGPRFAEQVPQG